MNFDLAALERRVAALESSQTASLRFGRVTSVKGGKCRVQFRDGQGMNSFELSSIQKRTLKDKDICMPDIDEPVACLFSGQGCEQGVMLGAYFNEREQDPEQAPHLDYKKYEDGTEIWYDREGHKLIAKVKGEANIECEREIKAESKEKITLKAPEIVIQGILSMEDCNGGPTTGTLKGNFHVVQGDITAESVSLRQHQHNNSGGDGVGGKPVGG